MTKQDRYRFRALEPDDVDWVLAIENDPQLFNLSDRYAPLSRYQLMEYALNYNADPFADGQIRLIMVTADSSEPVAVVDLYEIDIRTRRAFVGIVVCDDFRGKGIATTALRMLDKYTREILRLDVLAARIPVSNMISERLFAGCGYRQIARLPDWYAGREGLEDLGIWAKVICS